MRPKRAMQAAQTQVEFNEKDSVPRRRMMVVMPDEGILDPLKRFGHTHAGHPAAATMQVYFCEIDGGTFICLNQRTAFCFKRSS